MEEKQVVVIPAVQAKAGDERKEYKQIRVAAYCRVSTDEERQLGSFENQIEYFTRMISENSKYKLVSILYRRKPPGDYPSRTMGSGTGGDRAPPRIS